MHFRYARWEDAITRAKTLDKLLKLFTHLLTQSSGDVERALRWMDHLGKRHGFFDHEFSIEDFKEHLKETGLVRSNAPASRYELTSKGERRIQQDAFEEMFSSLKRDNLGGEHRTAFAGEGGEKLPETRPYAFGDMVSDIEFTRSISNAIRRNGIEEFCIGEEDLEVNELRAAVQKCSGWRSKSATPEQHVVGAGSLVQGLSLGSVSGGWR